MKKLIILCVITVSLFFYTTKLNAASEIFAPPGSNLEPKISLDFQDARLKDLLKVFSIQSGLNFVASEALQDRSITLYLDNVPMQQAMDQIFKANNLTYELDKEANIFIVKDWGKTGVETITKVFYLKHATVSSSSIKEEQSTYKDASSGSSSSSSSSSSSGSSSTNGKWKVESDSGITYSVRKLLSSVGSVMEDFRTNSLIVTDAPNRMKVISEVIASLDIEVPQIMLEVEMIDVNKNALDKMGVQYNDITTSLFTAVIRGAAIGTGFPIPNDLIKGITSTAGGLTPGMVSPGSVTFGSNDVTFDFIKQNSDAKVLARPKIMTLNNETAEIKITTDEVIGLITTQEGTGDSAANRTTTAERAETGVSLRVTPQINEDTGEITMFIFPSVKDATASSFAGYKDPEERSTKSIVRIKDGETVVIGGLIRHDRSQTDTKLPVLGDIPFIGGVFRHKNKDKDRERELLVFITPRIVNRKPAKLNEVKQIILPIREQNTAAGLNRSYMVNSAMNSFEKKGK